MEALYKKITKIDPRDLALVAVLAGLLIAFGYLSDRFLAYDNMTNLLLQSSITGIAATGLTFVIMTGGIDLSAGSTMNLALVAAVSAAGAAGSMEYTTETTWLVYPVALAAGALLGCLNALAIICLRLSPLIVTLATLGLYRGIALHVTGGREILVFGGIRDLGRGILGFGIGYPVIVMFALAVVAALFLRHFRIGRFVLAVGGSERSARENGLPTRRVLILAYGFAGFAAAPLPGWCWLAVWARSIPTSAGNSSSRP